jgi:cytochrome c
MLKTTGMATVFLWVVFVLLSFAPLPFLFPSSNFAVIKTGQGNHPPVVKIISPKNNNSYGWNSTVPYKISISDKEDGESKYDEINAKEVFLKIKYVKKIPPTSSSVKNVQSEESRGLAIIKTSNCMNCHAFKTKLIGPSFYDINKKYHKISGIENILADHILNGSKGRWGEVQMPSNNKLNASEAREVIRWIFKNADDSTVNFLAGIEGSFKIKPPDPSFSNVMLIASYTDHGLKDHTGENLAGEDTLFIKIK